METIMRLTSSIMEGDVARLRFDAIEDPHNYASTLRRGEVILEIDDVEIARRFEVGGHYWVDIRSAEESCAGNCPCKD